MVRVQVVTNVRVDTGPGRKSLKLALGLRHVTVEERKVTDIVGSHLGVRVGRVKSLVAKRGWTIFFETTKGVSSWWRGMSTRTRKRAYVLLNPAHETLVSSQLGQFLVVLQKLGSWLGDHDMMIALQSVLCNGKVGRVGSENF